MSVTVELEPAIVRTKCLMLDDADPYDSFPARCVQTFGHDGVHASARHYSFCVRWPR